MINRRERIWELRFGPHRMAYIVEEGLLILLTGWRKQSRQLDRQEAERAARAAADWRSRREDR